MSATETAPTARDIRIPNSLKLEPVNPDKRENMAELPYDTVVNK
jgi:hypothetical protein